MPTRSILRPLGRSMSTCLRQFSSTASRSRPADPSENATAALSSSLLAALKDSANASSARRPPPTTDTATRLQLLSAAFAKQTSAAAPTGSSSSSSTSSPLSGANSVSPQALVQSLPRRYTPGTVYAPHDLSAAEARKWSKLRKRPTRDRFDELGASAPGRGPSAFAARRRFRPAMLYRNFALLSQFTSETGRILHRNVTGLRGVNQRRLAKSVKRAVGLGLLPRVHAHPEVLRAVNGDVWR